MLIVTNNPTVSGDADIETRFVEGNTEELLLTVRDMVYEGYPLVSHPLPASIRMMYSPFRSVVLGTNAGVPDPLHVSIAEESLRKYRQSTSQRNLDKISEKSTESYKWMDAQLLTVAIKESAPFCQ